MFICSDEVFGMRAGGPASRSPPACLISKNYQYSDQLSGI